MHWVAILILYNFLGSTWGIMVQIFEKSVHLLFLGDLQSLHRWEQPYIPSQASQKSRMSWFVCAFLSLSSARAGVTTTTMTVVKSRPNGSYEHQKQAEKSK